MMFSVRDLGGTISDRLYQLSEQAHHLSHRAPVERYLDGRLDPVLLVPGVYETWQFLRPVGDRLNALGHPIHVLRELGYNRLTIDESATLAQRYLDVNALTHVIVVAHSKGGLIAKRMMVTDDSSHRISQLIAINSPFTGSSLANWAPVRTLRAFSPRNKTVMTLGANLEANARITSIYSRLDPLIPSGSRLEGATNIEFPLVGHFRPLAAGLLFEAVEKAVTPRR